MSLCIYIFVCLCIYIFTCLHIYIFMTIAVAAVVVTAVLMPCRRQHSEAAAATKVGAEEEEK